MTIACLPYIEITLAIKRQKQKQAKSVGSIFYEFQTSKMNRNTLAAKQKWLNKEVDNDLSTSSENFFIKTKIY